MRPFDYIRSGTIEEACKALAEHFPDARVLAGGTDLLIELRRDGSRMPLNVVDISRVSQMNGVAMAKGTVRVGPLTTHAALQTSDLIRKDAHLLSVAAATIGSTQIRNRGTVGGNIMNAAACADTVPPLIALQAAITLRSSSGSRVMDLADLFLEPYKTRATAAELLTEIRFPVLPPRSGSAFVKLGRRNALSISRLSVAAVLTFSQDGVIAGARIVPGAAFPVWRRAIRAENVLVGERPSPQLFSGAGAAVSTMMLELTGRRWSTPYKEPVIGVLVKRALELCRDSAFAPERATTGVGVRN